jgi:hypothetical protein
LGGKIGGILARFLGVFLVAKSIGKTGVKNGWFLGEKIATFLLWESLKEVYLIIKTEQHDFYNN